jgi:Uma2 family endonuclease
MSDVPDGIEPHDWSLVERNLRLTPDQRLAKLTKAANFVLAGRRAMEEALRLRADRTIVPMSAVIDGRLVHVRVDEWDRFDGFDSYRFEIIGGDLVVSPAPDYDHAHAAFEVATLLDRAAPDGNTALPGGVEWRFEREGWLVSAPRPDVVVSEPAHGAKALTTTPLLVVEILSASDWERAPATGLYRCEAKRRDYALNGLVDYLELDRPADGPPVLRRYELNDGKLVLVDTAVGDQPLVAERPFAYTVVPSSLFR